MEWLQKINDASNHQNQYPEVVDLDEIECKLNYNHPKNRVNGSKALRSIVKIEQEEFLCGYQAHCFALCMCCDFFACDCRMQCPEGCACYHDSTWSANVIQCSMRDHIDIPPLIPMDATSIYLDGNNFTGTLESQAFIGRKKVQHLFLNGSQIEAINNQTFNGLTELEVLHLEDNYIVRLEGYEFGNLTSLKQLYLQDNRLTFIHALTFSSLVSLEELHLNGNQLSNYPVWDLIVLPSLSHVTVSDNEWNCNCDFVHKFQEFSRSTDLVADYNNVQCQSLEDNSLSRFSENVTCSDALAVIYQKGHGWLNPHLVPIFVVVTAICIVIACISVMLFVFRTPLRVWLHSKYGIRVLDPVGKSSQDKLYDAFVSYSHKDDDFVQQIIVPQLEHSDPSYKLCLQHRDLPNNSSIADSFPGVSHLCAKHILIVTRHYLESEWTQIKFAMQDLSKKFKPVIILVEELSSLDLAAAPEFNLLLKTGPLVCWNEAGFWNKLRFYLPDAQLKAYKRNINSTLKANSSTNAPVSAAGAAHHHQQGSILAGMSFPLTTQSAAASPAKLQQQNGHLKYHNGSNNTAAGGGAIVSNSNWNYDGILHSNNSSTSTRSTEAQGSPRSSSNCSDASGSSTSHRTNTTGGGGHNSIQLVSNPLAEHHWTSPHHQHAGQDHTYQTIGGAGLEANSEHIYHTLEPGLAQGAGLQGFDTLGKLDVMLPNGQFVPATLVRNKNGSVVPLVDVGVASGGSSSGASAANAHNTMSSQSMQQQHDYGNALVEMNFKKSSATARTRSGRAGGSGASGGTKNRRFV